MKLTKSDLNFIKRKGKVQTSGRYKLDAAPADSWCRCPPVVRQGFFPNNCRTCGSRVRI